MLGLVGFCQKYADYLAEENEEMKKSGGALLEKGHISTLRWMLDCNMGCDLAGRQAGRQAGSEEAGRLLVIGGCVPNHTVP